MATIDYQEFEERLQSMKKELESNIARLIEEMEAIVTDEGINDMEDLASLDSDNMHHTALLKQQRHELAEVIHALPKLNNSTYGICEESGDTIPIERLRAEPHTRYCVDDAKKTG
ncbi:MAG: TraR/DksA C4-type zinc finger protein, partial [Thiovulaceae bacterium]|nr:TraR/DksA C4-type zinc finger protein [Sulfurimonadaceae bacterium]